MKWLRRIGVGFAVVMIAAVIYVVAFPRYLGPTRTNEAARQSISILQACEAYCDHADNPTRGKFPSALADLVEPPFGGPSFLRDGQSGLIDPWGRPYRYAVVTNDNGEQEVYVWGERTVKDKLELVGAKKRANGSIEVFGLKD